MWLFWQSTQQIFQTKPIQYHRTAKQKNPFNIRKKNIHTKEIYKHTIQKEILKSKF
jgi:hypothetical protein